MFMPAQREGAGTVRPPFATSALERCSWSVPLPGRFTPRKNRVPITGGWVYLGTGLDSHGKSRLPTGFGTRTAIFTIATTLPRSPSFKSFRTCRPVRAFGRRKLPPTKDKPWGLEAWIEVGILKWGMTCILLAQCLSATELTHFLF
jgi:hypothetical protein